MESEAEEEEPQRAAEVDQGLMGEVEARLVGTALEAATAARPQDIQAAAKAAEANPSSRPPAPFGDVIFHAQTPEFSRCWRLVGCG